MKILLIEDDEVLIDILLKSLTSQNYVVDTAQDGQSGWDYAESAEYDLILLDVGLPKMDGIALCQRLRTQGCATPILLMTAKDASQERIRGLDAGADDYLTKPLDLAELQARVRALLRRGTVPNLPILQIGDLVLNPSSCQVTYAAKPLTLTPKEYSLLELFLRNPSRVFSRGQILQHLWTFDDPPLEESVKAHVKGLRQKLKAAGAADWIENVYGIGYRLKEGAGDRERGAGDAETSIQNSDSKIQNSKLSPISNTSTVEHQFSQAMEDLWERYGGLMAQRLAVLQEATTAIQVGDLTPELRQCASQAAHKLAGVLGMFEREVGTLLGREIEQILLGDQALSSAQAGKVVSLVQELAGVLSDLGKPFPLAENVPSPEVTPLLLIDSDSKLSQELQVLGRSTGMDWKQVESLETAESWLRSHTPALVVLGIDAVGQWERTLGLLSDLTARTPPIPLLVLAAAGLLDRVTVARAGGQGFLVKPVTADQVWETTTQLLQRHRSQSVRVLVVDDDPVFLAALRSLLSPWGIRTIGLNDPLRFWDVLQSVAPDLLILDVEMPEISGVEICQAVRMDPTWQGLPILFLTAHKDSQTVQQVFAAGADDFIMKPVVGPELLTRISNRLERNRLLQTLSTRDALTGMTNQPHSSQELERLLRQSSDNRQRFCLVVLSVVELRSINIQYGHATGNQVLQRWGQIFQAAFSGGEVLGYWGNGEFVIGIPGLQKAEIGDRLSDVLKTLRQQVFTAPDGQRFQATCQVAIAEYPIEGTAIPTLYQAANS